MGYTFDVQMPKFTVKFDDGRSESYTISGSYSQSSLGCQAACLYSIGAYSNGVTHGIPWEPDEPLIRTIITYLLSTGIGKQYPKFTFVLMGDCVNKDTPCRPYYGRGSGGKFKFEFHTSTLVEYLIKYRIGTMYCSPIGKNVRHNSPEDFSLSQMWIWIPEYAYEFIIPNSAQMFNPQEPDRETWAKAVFEGWQSQSMSPETKKILKDRNWNSLVASAMRKASVLFKSALKEENVP